MRKYDKEILAANNAENTEALIKIYNELLFDLAFFEKNLDALRAILAGLDRSTHDEKQGEMLTDYQAMVTYVGTLKKYIEGVQSSSAFIFKINKMSAQDIVILKSQHASVKAMRKLIENDENNESRVTSVPEEGQTASSDQLSVLIDDATKLTHSISYKRAWLRRGATVLGGLVAAAACVGLVCLLMTPGVNIAAAAVGIPATFFSIFAFLKLHAMVTTVAHVGFFKLSVPVPATLGEVASIPFGAALVRKLHITNPVREEDARQMQAATINTLTNKLMKKINQMEAGEVKRFLVSVVTEADKMYNAGLGSWFYESQQSKMQKASLILKETAKIVEGKISADASVAGILKAPISNDTYTFGELLNAQRRSVSFWKSTSNLMRSVRPSECVLRSGKTRSISLSAIAKA